MAIIFTVCSNNYLAQASVLALSVKKHMPGVQFFTVLVDTFNEAIDYSKLPFAIIPVDKIEPDIIKLADKYNIVELNTSIKPQAFNYLFENFDEEQILYLDPDITVYNSLDDLFVLFDTYEILLTPHIHSPIQIDGRTPTENTFLNYGLYNTGFIGVRKSNESIKFLDWWKSRTYDNGFDKIEKGVFVDQLYINLIPIFFKKVLIVEDMGCNMGPWNLHERYLIKQDESYMVNGKEALKFFHFGSFKINSNQLPVWYYNRFFLKDREDLQDIYSTYNENLVAAGHIHFQTIDCVYYEQFIDKRMASIEIAEQKKWETKSFFKRLFIKVVPKSFFSAIQSTAQKIIDEYPYAQYQANRH